MTETPTLQPRPKMDRWLRDRGLGATDLGKRWGLTPQGASRYLLPFGHPQRIIPNEERLADAVTWTRGEVVVADWYDPELSGAPRAASVGDLIAARPQGGAQ